MSILHIIFRPKPKKNRKARSILHPSGKILKLHKLPNEVIALIPEFLSLFSSKSTSNGEFSFSPDDDKAAESILVYFSVFVR